MKKITLILTTLILPCIIFSNDDIGSLLMRSTYKIEGYGSVGTCFIIGEPVSSGGNKFYFVLVTAAHVLDNINSDMATIYLRKYNDEVYIKYPFEIKIKSNKVPIYTKHPSSDIAAMYISLPKGIDLPLLPTSFLADNNILIEYEVKPGDELFALGYPLGNESNDSGFPILRTGNIASYPIVPTKDSKKLLFDFEIYKGNSGGPVFLRSENRVYGGGAKIGVVRFIVGLVSQEKILEEKIKTLSEEIKRQHPIKIAVVEHATYIKETIDMLPKLK